MKFSDLFNKKPQTVSNPAPAEPSAPEAPATTSEPEAKAADGEVTRVFNLIILDESGSMSSVYREALTGVNETLQTIREAQKEHADQRHFVSLVTFDTSHFNQIYRLKSGAKATDITEAQYRPCGGTPLYDAMGRAITELSDHVVKGDVVLVTVITDGYENASREYSGKDIKALVERMKEQEWVFTYIGANQDVEAVASSMAINNCLEWESTAEGAKAMFKRESSSRKRFFSRVSQCKNDMSGDISDDFFE